MFSRKTEFTVAGITGRALAALLWLLGIACILPVLVMLAGAFWHEGHPSLEHIRTAYSGIGRIAGLLLSSLVVTLGSTSVSLILGVPIGFLCFRTDLPLRRAIILGSLIAACIPIYVTATAWMALFGMEFWLYSAWGASWIQGIAYTPLVILVTGLCFAAADRQQEEAAAMHTDVMGIFRHVSLPRGAWSIAVAGVLVAILSISDITVTDILTVRTFAEEVFTQFQLGSGPWRAAAMSFPVIVIMFCLAAVVWRQFREHGEVTIPGLGQAPQVLPLGRMRYVLVMVILIAVAAFFVVPMASLIRAVGSLKNLVTSYHTSQRELFGTLRTTPLAATLCVVLSIGGAWVLVKVRRWRWPVSVMILLLISVPAPIIGIGLIKILNHPGILGRIYDSEAVLVGAYVIRTLPFGILVMIPAMKRIPAELDDLLALGGGSWFQRVFSVLVPLCWRDIAVAWLLVFVLSLAEMGASFLVVPPGQATLTLRFFTLIHYGVYPDAAGICLILLGIVAIAASGIAALLWPTMTRRFV